MRKSKYFDRDINGKLVPATKLYINNTTYEIEEHKTKNNFEVDTLIAEAVSILNKNGYYTTSSNSGHIYAYFLADKLCYSSDLQTDSSGSQYLERLYHGMFPARYYLVSIDDEEYKYYIMEHKNIFDCGNFLEKITGDSHGNKRIFRVVFSRILIRIEFKECYDFHSLPDNSFPSDWIIRGFEGKLNDYSKVKEIHYSIPFDFDNINLNDLENKIKKANNEILEWVKKLPNNV